jgi:signal transduction histidine kinase
MIGLLDDREDRTDRGRRSGAWSRGIRRYGLLIVLVPLLFQVLFVALIAVEYRTRNTTRRVERRIRESISAAYRLHGLMIDAETGMRGFLLTHDRSFLEPYQKARVEVAPQSERLRALAGPTDLTSLLATMNESLDFSSATVADAPGPRAPIVAAEQHQRGKQLMDRFRDELRRFVQQQEHTIAGSYERYDRAEERLRTLIYSGLALNCICAAMLLWFFSRSISERVEVVTENTRRFRDGRPLASRLTGSDEIAELDASFHEMVAANRKAVRSLESANGELEAFSYSVSHDLRSPIRAIDGYARLLEEDYAPVLDEEGRRFLTTVRNETRRMGALIDDLLAFARVARSTIAETTVDVEVLVQDIVAELAATVPRMPTVTITNLPPARGDRALLRQVFSNLLQNAVKFSTPAGEPHIAVTATVDGDECTYSVRDNGVGFDMRYVDKLFGVFQRLHRFDEFEGTGVGLAIVQRIVRRHGGRVGAESSLGSGAVFHVTLPLAAAIFPPSPQVRSAAEVEVPV